MLLATLAGCGGGGPTVLDSVPEARPLPPARPLGQVYVLESWGVPAEDTVAVLPVHEPRLIMVRRGAPDHSVFAEIQIPAGGLVSEGGTATGTLTLLPRPGEYGLDIQLEPGSRLAGALTLTFSYAVHFVMPQAARERYPSPLAFERELYIAQVGPDGMVTFLPSRRPASDLLSATVPGPGRYIVVAPR